MGSTSDPYWKLRELLVGTVCLELFGVTYGDLYRNKSHWTEDRGQRHDINVPFQHDVDAAVNEIIDTIRAAGWRPPKEFE